MSAHNPQPLDEEKSLRIRRGRVESVDLYEIKDTELDHFEHGAPGDLQLNFAIFLLSTAFSSICALATASFQSETIENTFLFTAIIGVILGVYLVIAWWRSRTPTKALCKKIRDRIPPDQAMVMAVDAEPDPDPDSDEPTAPVG